MSVQGDPALGIGLRRLPGIGAVSEHDILQALDRYDGEREAQMSREQAVDSHEAREERSAGHVIAVLRQEARERDGTRQGRMWGEMAYELERRWPQGPRREA
jgi:hypothetical protein